MTLPRSTAGVELVAEPNALAGLGATLLLILPFVLLVWAGIYLWTGFAGARLFARTGGEPWKAWVPFVSEAEVFARGGKPAYSLVYCFIPVVAIYGLVVRIAAVHRINRRFGLGAGATALGIVLPPIWMSVLAWGPEPLPEAVANDADDEDADDPATMFAPRDASGYAIPVAAIEIQPIQTAAAVEAVQPAVPAPPAQLAPVIAPAPGILPTPPSAPPSPAGAVAAEAPAAPAAPVAPPAPAAPAAPVAPVVPAAPSRARYARWRIETSDGQAFELTAPSIVLGRGPVASVPEEQRIAIADATRTLSKTHARLEYRDGVWQLTDLDSTNGVHTVDSSGTRLSLAPGETRPAGERFMLGDVEIALGYDLVDA
ncbi:DUF5684 domain-containing protein [Agromyces sp. NPDC058136]|uniref:DUF5684 domain-containing protein n=1 Tax=Agromyces sp. NPDC058136 TaxID=3346354 RepID=UPI0036D9DA0F